MYDDDDDDEGDVEGDIERNDDDDVEADTAVYPESPDLGDKSPWLLNT